LRISVLYIHHIGIFGGSSRSLLELIKAFPGDSIKPYLITQRGNIITFFKDRDIPTIKTFGISKFDNTKYGYYKKLRWLLLIREFTYLFSTIFALFRAKVKWDGIDIVHINEITCLPTLLLAKLIFRKPIIIHARAVQAKNENPIREFAIKNILEKFSNTIIAIDKTVKSSLPDDLRIHVVHNGYRPQNISKNDMDCVEALREIKGNQRYLKAAIVGNLLKFKGVYEFAEAAKLCFHQKLSIKFFIVGATKKSSRGIKAFIIKKMGFFHYIEDSVVDFIKENCLDDYLHLLEFTPDIYSIYNNIDIICFPSYLNAVGRPVLEAAFFKVPSIVAINDPYDDMIIDGETGICIKEKSPQALTDAIKYFYSNPEEIKRMGEAAYQLAIKNFDIQKNAKKLLSIYYQCIKKT